MPSLMMIESPLHHQATGAWGSLYSAQEPVKPRPVLVPAAPAKKPAYGGVRRRRNLETCTEALGCETGAVDPAAPAGTGFDGDAIVEAECAERKRRAREENEEEAMAAGRMRRSSERRRPLPPPLTTLARGAGRVRMVHERHDGRLEVYAVRTPGVLEAERSGGRLRMHLLPRPCHDAGNAAAAACCRQEPEAKAEEVKEADREEEEEEYGFSAYVRGGRCVEPEGGAAAARRGKQWELQLCHQYPCIV